MSELNTLSIVAPFETATELNFALWVLTVFNFRQRKAGRVPPLMSAGVRYAEDVCRAANVPGACERFVSAINVMREGGLADCDDLAPWLCADLWIAGDRRALPFAIPSPVGWHCLVKNGRGLVLDPSADLGMPK